MNDATAALIDHALGIEWTRLTANDQRAARTFLHDSLCVGVAGRNAANADLIFAAAADWGGQGMCPVLGRSGMMLGAPYAAFANAFQIHAQEFDCVHEPAVAHPLATVLAALLAEAGRGAPVSGSEFLAALVAGVDVVATLGIAATSPLKFFRPATAGIFGCVAAMARLRRLSAATTRDAFGYALAFAGGTMQAHVEGLPTLAVQVAAAARSAVEALDLARAGLPGPRGSLEGPFGYLSLFEDRHELTAAVARLATGHRIAEVSWKPFPTGRAAHGAIVATQMLMREQGLTASDLDTLTYRAPPLIHRLVGRRPTAGMTVATARLCFPWLGALVLTRGTVRLGDFTPERLADLELMALAERISVEADSNPDPAAFAPAEAVAAMNDGRVLRQGVERQFGSPEWPLSRDDHLAKAQACLAFGGRADAYGSLLPVLDDFADAPDAMAVLAAAF